MNYRSVIKSDNAVKGIDAGFSLGKKAILIVVIALLGGIFSFAYATTSGVVSFGPTDSAADIATVHSSTVENSDVGPYSSAPSFGENVIGGTGGAIENGNMFWIEPSAQLNTGLWVQVELVNRGDVTEKFTSMTENFAVYQVESGVAKENWTRNDNWNMLTGTENSYLTLIGGPATFQIPSENVDNDRPLVVALESGDYYAKENYDSYPSLAHYLSVEEAGY